MARRSRIKNGRRPANISISFEAGAGDIGHKRITLFLNKVLKRLGQGGRKLSVLLTNDRGMRVLNKRFRGRDKTTDVLAFSMLEGCKMAGEKGLLGDVVICVDTIRQNARERGSKVAYEMGFCLAHGVLHLLGYKDGRAKDRKYMNSKTERLIKGIFL